MEILDKILEINTYTELISYFKEVIKQLGKTRIKSVYDSIKRFLSNTKTMASWRF